MEEIISILKLLGYESNLIFDEETVKDCEKYGYFILDVYSNVKKYRLYKSLEEKSKINIFSDKYINLHNNNIYIVKLSNENSHILVEDFKEKFDIL